MPEPRANPLLIGQNAAEAALLGALRAGRMHHAWLLTGPEGVGKATLAFRFARWLLAGAPEGPGLALDAAHPVFRRVAAGGHADLLTVQRGLGADGKKPRAEIGVDEVRAVGAFLRLTPAEGGWRVVVVDRADELNRNAANALLKILEEPPARALLLLVCAAPGRLPVTVRSRCRRLALRPLDESEMADVLTRLAPDIEEAELARLTALAEGSPGRALLLRDAQGLALAGLVDEVLAGLPRPPGAGWDIAERLATGEGFSTFMDLLRAAIASAVRDAARGRADPEQARLAALRPLDAWGDVWHALSRLQDETERFALDRRQAILTGLRLLSGEVQGTP
ncbi:MAG: DNA polymerase III subunit delta' [Acetobacteraceae bacterium]|nr:DNA polymerase III subunit delta' [Acetobacteraceae bacterium]